MPLALIRKLEVYRELAPGDRRRIEHACRRTKDVARNTTVISPGETSDFVRVMLEGVAYRSKLTRDGQRQIVDFMLPGDLCNLCAVILQRSDHYIVTATACRFAELHPSQMHELTQCPAIGQALFWSMHVDEAVLKERLLSLGRRTAEARIAHFLCEFTMRMHAIGLAPGRIASFPITQTELADTMGLSTVSTNRVLQSLRRNDLIELSGRALTICDFSRLARIGEFDPAYLGQEAGARLDRPAYNEMALDRLREDCRV